MLLSQNYIVKKTLELLINNKKHTENDNPLLEEYAIKYRLSLENKKQLDPNEKHLYVT